jgi:hypothetical protein
MTTEAALEGGLAAAGRGIKGDLYPLHVGVPLERPADMSAGLPAPIRRAVQSHYY